MSNAQEVAPQPDHPHAAYRKVRSLAADLSGDVVLVPATDGIESLSRGDLEKVSHWSDITDDDVPRLAVLTDGFFRFIDEGEDASVITLWREGTPIVQQIDGEPCAAAAELVFNALAESKPLQEKWHGLPPLQAEIEMIAYAKGFRAGHRPKWLERVAREKLASKAGVKEEPVTARKPPAAANENGPRLISATPWRLPDPKSIPPREWLYGHHYIRKFVSVTISPGGVGKTSLGMGEALCMATGRELFGVKVFRRARVWLWNGEDPQDELDRRLASACIHHGIAGHEIDGMLFVNSGREMPLITAKQTKDGAQVAIPVVDALIEEIRSKGIDVMIIDPFVSSHAVSENDNMAMDAVVKQTWATIADRTNCSIDLVHHAKKVGGQEVTAESARGAVSLIGAARAARTLNPMTADEAGRANVDNRRLYFRETDAKSNLAPPSDKSTWYQMVGHDLGNATNEMPSDNVGVATLWKWPSAAEGLHVSDLLAVQRVIHVGYYKENVQADNWVGKAVAEALSLDAASEKDKARIKELLKIWVKSGALKKVDKEDANRKMKPHIVVGEWAHDT